jgi:hypothetical protein
MVEAKLADLLGVNFAPITTPQSGCCSIATGIAVNLGRKSSCMFKG